MVTKNDIKFINNLKHKKFRDLNNCFVVEGIKSINDFIDSNYKLIKLYSVDCSHFKDSNNQFQIDYKLLKKISYLTNPDDHFALFQKKKIESINVNGLIIALESIRDPGNLGTIIRTCDWFGVNEIICSLDSVDCYNPKVIQASMGSLSRVSIKYLNLKGFLKSSKHLRIGTTLNGSSIYDLNLNKAVLVFGNESNGISDELIELIDSKVTIPRFQKNNLPESLNLASSVAIILGEIKRKEL